MSRGGILRCGLAILVAAPALLTLAACGGSEQDVASNAAPGDPYVSRGDAACDDPIATAEADLRDTAAKLTRCEVSGDCQLVDGTLPCTVSGPSLAVNDSAAYLRVFHAWNDKVCTAEFASECPPPISQLPLPDYLPRPTALCRNNACVVDAVECKWDEYCPPSRWRCDGICVDPPGYHECDPGPCGCYDNADCPNGT